jgi:hypothetical protein
MKVKKLFEDTEDIESLDKFDKKGIVKLLQENCMSYLKKYGNQFLDDTPLFFARTMGVETDYGIKETRTDRKVRDTDDKVSKYLEQYMIDTYGKNYRKDKVVFSYKNESNYVKMILHYLKVALRNLRKNKMLLSTMLNLMIKR